MRKETAVYTMLLEFLEISGCITTYNFMKINIITLDYAYYKIIQLTHKYEHSTTLILHRT